MEDFFTERVINIEGVSYIMRPLKIKELPELQKVLRRAGRHDDFLSLVKMTIKDGDIDSLPLSVLPKLTEIFLELNFIKSEGNRAGDTRRKKEDEETLDELIRAIEFLISQGHSYSEIQEYTLPQFRIFVDIAVERITGMRKKKMDALESLKKLGIPIKKNVKQ